MRTIPLIKDASFRKLGLDYVGYRLVVALLIFGIIFLSDYYLSLANYYPIFLFTLGMGYIFLCLINFLTFKFYPFALVQQIFSYLFIDIIVLTITLYVSSGPNVTLILLYVMVILTATILLPNRQALFLTLLGTIAVIYQQFFMNFFSWNNHLFLGSSSLITLVFLCTYALGQLGNQRLISLQKIATDERAAFLQLQQINQNIIEQLDTGFMVIDQSNQIVMINDATKTLLQLPILAMQNQKNLLNILCPQLDHELKTQFKNNFKGFFQFIPIENPHAGLLIKYRPIITHEQNMTLLILDSLQKINQHVQQLKLASIGQLSASIAHEIRNPLAAISQANEILEEDLPDDLHTLTQMISKQCKRINRTIEETLDMSRQNQTLTEEINLYPWLKNFIKEDLIDIEKHLQFTIEDKSYIYFDPHQLRLVLINLIRNAVRHGHEHIPQSKVHIKSYRTAEYIFIDILDEGTGVDKNKQQNLFEPFFSTSINGTGLGLYLSRTFCEANHARLKYIPQTQGACFRIECLASENK